MLQNHNTPKQASHKAVYRYLKSIQSPVTDTFSSLKTCWTKILHSPYTCIQSWYAPDQSTPLGYMYLNTVKSKWQKWGIQVHKNWLECRNKTECIKLTWKYAKQKSLTLNELRMIFLYLKFQNIMYIIIFS